MKQIILDCGSGNTCSNDLSCVMQMIDSVPKLDGPEIILKWQLFKEAGENIPLERGIFDFAYAYGRARGFKTTASVFDFDSLYFLLQYGIPFVKIANNRQLDYLTGFVPRNIPIYLSWDGTDEPIYPFIDELLSCESKYPATIADYYTHFSTCELEDAVSDHTVGTELYRRYQPRIWEKHFKLPDSAGLDAGPFAITPAELEELLKTYKYL
jgi:sialic acid synthase SpsE